MAAHLFDRSLAMFQVEGVETDELAFQPAARFGPIMDEVHDRLVERSAPSLYPHPLLLIMQTQTYAAWVDTDRTQRLQ